MLPITCLLLKDTIQTQCNKFVVHVGVKIKVDSTKSLIKLFITCWRKNRNLYAQLLLQMVKRGLLEEPFTRRPEAGPLQALPSYMVCHLCYYIFPAFQSVNHTIVNPGFSWQIYCWSKWLILQPFLKHQGSISREACQDHEVHSTFWWQHFENLFVIGSAESVFCYLLLCGFLWNVCLL